MSMSIEEAIRILDPETSADAIKEIKYYAGLNKDNPIKKVDEACVIACNVMREHLEDVEIMSSNKDSYEDLKQMPHEKVVNLFFKMKRLFNKACERCDELEKENIELTDMDELIDSISESDNSSQREQIIDEVSTTLIDYFSEHAHEVWNRVSARDFICDNIEMITEELKKES